MFIEEHYLDTHYGSLAPDSEQATAWYRLRDGDYIGNDIDWFIHEYAESILLRGPGKNVVRPAHQLLNQNDFGWPIPRYKNNKG